MKITEILEAVNRPMPKTDLRVGDHVVADTSKEQYPGGHKSRSGKVTRVGQTGVHIQPDDGGEREYHPYKIVKKSQSQEVDEAATAGATSSGSIATVVNPGMTNKNPAAGSPGKMAKKSPPQWMPKKQTPKDNALDKNVGLLTGTPIRR